MEGQGGPQPDLERIRLVRQKRPDEFTVDDGHGLRPRHVSGFETAPHHQRDAESLEEIGGDDSQLNVTVVVLRIQSPRVGSVRGDGRRHPPAR